MKKDDLEANNRQRLLLENQQLKKQIIALREQINSQITNNSPSSGYAIFDNILEGCQVIDRDWKYLYINDAAVIHNRQSRAALIGHTLMQAFPGIEKLELFSRLQLCMEQHISQKFETSYLFPDGLTGWYELIVHPVPEGILILSNETTQSKITEIALRESEEQYRIIFDLTNDYAYRDRIDPDGTIIPEWISSGVERITGYTTEELSDPALLAKMIHPDDLPAFMDHMKRVLQGIQSKIEGRILTKDGRIRWMIASDYPVYDPIQKRVTHFYGAAQDITERKEIEIALRESEYFFKESQRAAFIGSYKTDFVKGFWESSEVLDAIFGIGKDYIRSVKGWLDLVHPGDLEMMDRYLKEEVIAKRLPFNKEYRIVRKADGEIRWVHGFGNVEFDPYGNILLMVGTIQDITERKATEEMLAKREEQYRILAESAEDIINLVDRNFTIVYTNKFAADKFNLSPQELTGKKLTDLYPPEISSRQMANLTKVFETGESLSVEAPTIFPDGMIWTNTMLVPIKEKDGAVHNILVISRDITQRKQAVEQALKLSTAIEQSPATIVITDTEGNIEYVNPAFTKITGYSPEEALGKNPRILKSEEHDDFFYRNLWETILSGQTWRGEIRNKKKNGELYWESASISPVINGNNIISHFVAVKDDITPQKKMMEDLIAAKEQAEESDRLKSAFLANMSHEIRTPMNGILGFTELLQRPGLTEHDKVLFIDVIRKSGNRMLNTINDLIEISSIETGHVTVNDTETQLNDVFKFLYSFFEPQATEKGIRLSCNCPLPDRSAVIVTDKDKLEKVLINLVRNAIKFTEIGIIEFGYSTNGNTIEFYVRDTGMGIPADRQEAIFGRFVQADISLSRPYEGSGLGLSISKAYVEMLGGKIGVTSKEGKGSTFRFTLPLRRATSPGQEEFLTRDLMDLTFMKDFTILIAEDEETGFLYLKALLEPLCKAVLRATTGIEAISLCRNNVVDIVLMDIKMPVMDGHAATRKIREYNKNVVILAQTAYALEGDKEKALQSGCNDYITKPIREEILFEKIRKYAGNEK